MWGLGCFFVVGVFFFLGGGGEDVGGSGVGFWYGKGYCLILGLLTCPNFQGMSEV